MSCFSLLVEFLYISVFSFWTIINGLKFSVQRRNLVKAPVISKVGIQPMEMEKFKTV